ncbi:MULTISPECIES: hypothetical protein [unclassified Beijerinckia]|uniref:hypothetical protein n=1 Tax=unclassified Beijerinckia TaxID=2638183 RepID=UPI0008996892|nr:MULTISPECIES: hypothetical protein [unclassified Beijerinckia]MDH7794126.1 hypothetical protein [Beijerinckia sp. GAS462]SEB53856.1 hypothetical protein SAMN05443249_0391 [Beijerinckia sp. 28-YEA-48]
MRVLVGLVFGILVACWIGVAQARDDFGWTLDDAKALVKDLTGRALELKGCVPGVVHDGQDCAFFGKGPSQYQTNWEFEVSPEGNVAGVVLRYFTDDGLDLGRPSDARFPGQAIAGVVAVAAGKVIRVRF